MKFALTALTLCLSFAAIASPVKPGSYALSHKIGLMYAGDAASCKENDGQWSTEDEMCIAEGSNTIDVQEVQGTSTLKVSISVVGSNIHTCDFEGTANKKSDGSLLVKSDKCELVVSADAKGVNSSVVSGREEACSQFCGMNVDLNIEGAK